MFPQKISITLKNINKNNYSVTLEINQDNATIWESFTYEKLLEIQVRAAGSCDLLVWSYSYFPPPTPAGELLQKTALLPEMVDSVWDVKRGQRSTQPLPHLSSWFLLQREGRFSLIFLNGGTP